MWFRSNTQVREYTREIPVAGLATARQRLKETRKAGSTPEQLDQISLSDGQAKKFEPSSTETVSLGHERLTFSKSGTYVDLASGKIRNARDQKIGRVGLCRWDQTSITLSKSEDLYSGPRQTIQSDGTTCFWGKDTRVQYTIRPDGQATISTKPGLGKCLQAAFVDPPKYHPDDDGSLTGGLLSLGSGIGQIFGIGIPDEVQKATASVREDGKVVLVNENNDVIAAIQPLLSPKAYW